MGRFYCNNQVHIRYLKCTEDYHHRLDMADKIHAENISFILKT